MAERIVVKNVRLSYPHLFKAQQFEGQEPKFGCVLIVPKTHPQIEEMREKIYKEAATKFASQIKGDKWPVKLHYPVKDGDEQADEHPEYEGCYIISTSAKQQPVILDRQKRVLNEADGKPYAGCYVNASLAFGCFDVSAKKGVGAYVNGIQFVSDGERLAGHDATTDFEELDDDEDGFDSLLG